VSLETGIMEAFAAARSLYATVGFSPCAPFGDYLSSRPARAWPSRSSLPLPPRTTSAEPTGRRRLFLVTTLGRPVPQGDHQ
jgi:hypothetical protein